jgi:glycolate oxidase
MRGPGLAHDLRQVVGKANVLDSGVNLRLYGYDAYLEERRPDAVVFVQTTDEVAGVVKVCNEWDVPFVARGGGTNLSGGTVPIKGGVVIEMIRMNRILEVDVKNLRARVQPGMFNLEFGAALARSATSTCPTRRARKPRRSAATWPRTPAAPTASSTASRPTTSRA